jgi:hypothetical protein
LGSPADGSDGAKDGDFLVIRTSLPATPSRQFSLRLDALTHRTRRALDQRRRSPGKDVPASAEARDAALLSDWEDAVARKRQTFDDFDNRFDRLVGVVCDAAREGLTPAREDRYREQRVWFVKNYEVVKRDLSRHLPRGENDTAPGLWGRRPCDAFEALFLPVSLKALLGHDGGRVIDRLNRAQEAVAAYAEELARTEAEVRS